MKAEEVKAFFTQHGVDYDERELEHGLQVKAKTQAQECVTVYKTGAVTVGGRPARCGTS